MSEIKFFYYILFLIIFLSSPKLPCLLLFILGNVQALIMQQKLTCILSTALCKIKACARLKYQEVPFAQFCCVHINGSPCNTFLVEYFPHKYTSRHISTTSKAFLWQIIGRSVIYAVCTILILIKYPLI